MQKLGVVLSHPIQYYSPLFRYLARSMRLAVLYGFEPDPEQAGTGFGVNLRWDVDLLGGYEHRLLKNRAARPATQGFSAIDVPDVGRAIRDEGITHVLICGWQFKFYWQAYFHCLRNGVPVSVRGDSQINRHEPGWKSAIRRTLYPRFLRRYDNIFYVGSRNRDFLLLNGARASQLRFAPHAVDQEFWTAPAARRQQDGIIRFLWVAKFIDKKRPLDAVTAFRKAAGVESGIELTMIGSGELLAASQREAAGEPRIRFAGFRNQTELRDVYPAADCLILSSDARETWGLVVNEAMAAGLPAIVSKECGCSADMIEDGSSGFVYETGDTDGLAARIVAVARRMREDPLAFRDGIQAVNARHSFETNRLALEGFLRGQSVR